MIKKTPLPKHLFALMLSSLAVLFLEAVTNSSLQARRLYVHMCIMKGNYIGMRSEQEAIKTVSHTNHILKIDTDCIY